MPLKAQGRTKQKSVRAAAASARPTSAQILLTTLAVANAFEFKNEKNQAEYEKEEALFGPYQYPNHHKIPNVRGIYGESTSFREAVQECLEESPVYGLCYDQKYGAMKDWDVTEITDFSWAFSGYTNLIERDGVPTGRANFNADLSNWRPTNAKRMDHMFYYAVDFNQDISKWGWRGGMAHKQPQAGMFQGAIEFQRRFKCPDTIEGPVHQCREIEGWKPQEAYVRKSDGQQQGGEGEAESSITTTEQGNNNDNSGSSPVRGLEIAKGEGESEKPFLKPPRAFPSKVSSSGSSITEEKNKNHLDEAESMMGRSTKISDEDVEAFLKADPNTPLSEVLNKMKKSNDDVSKDIDDNDDADLNAAIQNLKSKAKKYVTSSKSFDPSYELIHDMPSKYNKDAVTSNSFESYSSSLAKAPTDTEASSSSVSEDENSVRNSKFEAEKALLMKQLADLEDKNKDLEEKTSPKSKSKSSSPSSSKDDDDVKKENEEAKAKADAGNSSSDSKNSEFELLKSMKAKLDDEVRGLKNEIFNVKGDSDDENENASNEEVAEHKHMTEDAIHNAIGLCLQEAAIDGKCTEYGKKSGYGEMPDWDVSHITDMEKLFYKKWHFNADLSKWDTSQVTNMKKMFYYAFEFSQDLSGWTGGAAMSKQENMFNGASRFQANYVCKDKETGPPSTCISLAAKTGKKEKTSSSNKKESKVSESVEEEEEEKAEKEQHSHDLKKVTDATLRSAISKCLNEDPITGNCEQFGARSGFGVMSYWDTSEVTDMKKAFYKFEDFDGDISQWNTGQVTNMMYMFFGAKNFNHYIGSWDVSNVADMSFMFYGAKSYNMNMDKWDCSKVISMQKMFLNANSFDRPIHLTWKGTAATTKQLNLFKDAKAWNAKYTCDDENDGPLTSCSDSYANGNQEKPRSSSQAGASSKEIEDDTDASSNAQKPASSSAKPTQVKEYDIQAFGKSMTAKLEYDEATGQVKGWIIDENAGKEAMLGMQKRGTWRFFKAPNLGASRTTQSAGSDFSNSVLPMSGLFVVIVVAAALRRQRHIPLAELETLDAEERGVVAPKYGIN